MTRASMLLAASAAAAVATLLALGINFAAVAAPDDAPPTTHVTVHVTEWEFTSVSPDSAPTGTVVFTIYNDGDFGHDFSIAGHTTPVIPGGRSTTLTVFFGSPAVHTYFSTVDDWDREMWGGFTVTGPVVTPPTTVPAPAPAPPVGAPPTATLALRKVGDVPLPGEPSRFDYQSVDSKRRRLFIAHLGAGRVISFDLAHQRVAGVVGGVSDVRGVLAVPSLGLLYAAATGTRQLMTFDERTLRKRAVAPAGAFPDGIAYDPVGKRVFVSDVSGRRVTVFHARTGKRFGAVGLAGTPGNVQYDSRTRRIVVAVGSRDELAAIDPKSLRVVKRVHLSGCDDPHGVEVVSASRRAFVACEGNASLVVVDLKAMRQRAVFAVGAGPDVLDFDPGLNRLYVASESGIVTVFQAKDGETAKLGEAKLDEHAHSVAVDPATHRVYFPLENVDGRPVLRVMQPT